MNDKPLDPPGQNPARRERAVVWTLCLLGALHVLVYSAAFPFFNPSDEQSHFDTIIHYSHGHLPRKLDLMSEESMGYVRAYFSPEYIYGLDFFAGGQYPPPPWLPDRAIDPHAANPSSATLVSSEQWRRSMKDKPATLNYEASQPPLYYALAGIWWRAGKILHLPAGFQLYWLRFLNALFLGALVWAGHAAARRAFPKETTLRLAVPALIAFMPQTAFYSLSNDMLSALAFGLAFIGLVEIWRADIPGIRLGLFTGLMLAAAFLTKSSNLPLLGIAAGLVMFKGLAWIKVGNGRAALPALLTLVLSAVIPMIAWTLWCKIVFGDLTASALKTQILGWTLKPFAAWWSHPIFSLAGFWSFLSGLLVTFWQGEFSWHGLGHPLNLPAVNAFYVIPTIAFLVLAILGLSRKAKANDVAHPDMLWLGLFSLVACIGFLGFLSIIYDFGDCQHPSREDPYFNHGRLMLGALIPFMLLLVYGVRFILQDIKARWFLPAAFAGTILFMVISEIVTCWPVFQSQYNFYHL